ncbi:MAG: hypothetical protein LIP02_06525 [Bacteroidales bacterium]|nr:hypothetical protein [Bacteroidales bacterium]
MIIKGDYQRRIYIRPDNVCIGEYSGNPESFIMLGRLIDNVCYFMYSVPAVFSLDDSAKDVTYSKKHSGDYQYFKITYGPSSSVTIKDIYDASNTAPACDLSKISDDVLFRVFQSELQSHFSRPFIVFPAMCTPAMERFVY